MGMDVYGLEPRTETGKYFRNNCWHWRPLWFYCEQVAPELTDKAKYGQSNDGDGLKTQDDCDALAAALMKAVADGVPWTNGKDELDRHVHNGESMYPFDYENVLEFVLFLKSCGGFAIN